MVLTCHEIAKFITEEDLKMIISHAESEANRIGIALYEHLVKKFEDLSGMRPSVSHDKSKWLMNLSSRKLSEMETSVLQRGLQFSVTPKDLPIAAIVSEVENGCSRLREHEKTLIRAQVSNILLSSRKPRPNLSRDEMAAVRALKEDDSLVILNADKGACTVIMDKVEYDKKLLNLLDDAVTYTKLKKDPTKATETKMNALLLRIKREGQLGEALYFRLRSTDALCPRLYGLVKIHKEGLPVRPIVSFTGTSTHALSRHLSEILSPLLGQTQYTVRNSTEFVESLSSVKWREGDVMISFDVVALFTNIPVEKALEIAKMMIQNDSHFKDKTDLSVENFMSLLSLCLRSSDFSFRDTFYRQIFGCPMGSPISMTIANMVMEDLERRIFATDNDVLIWKRFADDTFVVLPERNISSFSDLINGLESSISFTMERETNNNLAFLDVNVKREPNGSFSTSVYRKPTHTNRYLQFDSYNPMAHKKAVVRTLVDRAKKLSNNDEMYNKEMNHIKESLSKNGYPAKLIRTCEHPRPGESGAIHQGKVVLPYIKGVSEQISRTLSKYGIQVAHRCIKKLRTCFKSAKDPVPETSQCGVVYKICCRDCDMKYIGQTKNSLSTRVGQHQAALRLMQPEKSALAEHAINCDHRIDWGNPAVIEKEARWRHRIFLETWHTQRMKEQCLNRCDGLFPSVYRPLLTRTKRPIISVNEH